MKSRKKLLLSLAAALAVLVAGLTSSEEGPIRQVFVELVDALTAVEEAAEVPDLPVGE